MAETIAWPTSRTISDAVKNLITTFYKLADKNAAETPEEMASLFTEDGAFHGLAGAVTGRRGKTSALASRLNQITA